MKLVNQEVLKLTGCEEFTSSAVGELGNTIGPNLPDKPQIVNSLYTDF